MNKKFGIALVIAGILLAIVPNLIPDKQTREAEPNTTQRSLPWTLPIPLRLESLDPQKVLSSIEKSLLLLPFSRLVTVNQDLQIEPDLLESWTYDVNQNTYRFRIRKDIVFHDGQLLNSDDVIFSIHRWARPDSLDHELLDSMVGVADYRSGKADRISGIHKIDSLTFDIKLTEWVESFVKNLSMPRFCVFPDAYRGIREVDFFQRPIGTGPFEVISYSQTFSSFRAFPRYHQGEARLGMIHVRYLNERDAITAFQNHQVDNLVMYDIVPNQQNFADDNIVIESTPSSSTFTIIIPGSLTQTADRDTRLRLAHLFDKQRIIQSCYPGSQLSHHIIAPGLLGSDMKTNLSDSDQANVAKSKIKTILPEGTKLHIPADLNSVCLKIILSEMLEGTGIQPVINDFGFMYELLKKGQLHLWIEPLEFKNEDPIGTLQYFSQRSNEFLLALKPRHLDKLFERAYRSLSDYERSGVYRSIDRYLTQNGFAVPLFHLKTITVYRKNLRGVSALRSQKYMGSWHLVERVQP